MDILKNLYNLYLSCIPYNKDLLLDQKEVSEIEKLIENPNSGHRRYNSQEVINKYIAKLELILLGINLPQDIQNLNPLWKASRIQRLINISTSNTRVNLKQYYCDQGMQHVKSAHLNEFGVLLTRDQLQSVIFIKKKDKGKVKNSEKLLNQYFINAMIRNEMQILAHALIIQFLNTKENQLVITESKFESYLEQMRSSRKNICDSSIACSSMLTEIILYQLTNRKFNHISFLNEIETIFKSFGEKFSFRKSIVLENFVKLCYNRGLVDLGLTILVKNESKQEIYSAKILPIINWKTIYLKCLCLIRLGNLIDANNIISAFKISTKNKVRPYDAIGKFETLHAFVHLLRFYKNHKMPANSGGKGAFRIYRFINRVAEAQLISFSKVNERIIYMLYLLKLRRISKYKSELLILKKFCKANLKNKFQFRTYCFIHLLSLVPNSYFNSKVLRRKAKNLLHNLSTIPSHSLFFGLDAEISSYEELAKITCDILDK